MCAVRHVIWGLVEHGEHGSMHACMWDDRIWDDFDMSLMELDVVSFGMSAHTAVYKVLHLDHESSQSKPFTTTQRTISTSPWLNHTPAPKNLPPTIRSCVS